VTFYEFYQKYLKIPVISISKLFNAIINAISISFDNLKGNAILTRNKFIALKTDDLQNFQVERGIERLPNESEETFKKRVVCAYTFYAKETSIKNIQSLVLLVTKKTFSIKDCQKGLKLNKSKLNNSSLAIPKYEMIIEFTEYLTIKEKQAIQELLQTFLPIYINFFIVEKV